MVALLTLSAGTALLLSGSIGRVMGLAGAIAATEIVLGLGVAFETNAPAGAVIVLGSAAVYLLALTWQRLRRRPAVRADTRQLHSPSATHGVSR